MGAERKKKKKSKNEKLTSYSPETTSGHTLGRAPGNTFTQAESSLASLADSQCPSATAVLCGSRLFLFTIWKYRE